MMITSAAGEGSEYCLDQIGKNNKIMIIDVDLTASGYYAQLQPIDQTQKCRGEAVKIV